MINFDDVKAFIYNTSDENLCALHSSLHEEQTKRRERKQQELKRNFVDAWKALTDAGYDVCWGADYSLEYGDSISTEDINIE